MPYRIDMLTPSVVEVIHTGDVTITEADQARREAAALMQQQGCTMLLADISDARVEDSEIQLFSFNASHYDVLPRGTLIATVASPQSLKPDLQRFAETVAVNRGIRLRVFQSREQALSWLEQPLSHQAD